MKMTVADLAERLHGNVEGDASADVWALAGLAEARPGDLSFLANAKYERQVAATRATAVIVARDWQGAWSCGALIRVDNPDKAFAEVAPLFAPPPVVRRPGVHPTAVIGAGVRLGREVHIGPCAVIDDDVTIGDRTVIDAQCFVGRGVTIGADGWIHPQVAIREGCRIGDRVMLHCGVVIGGDGYGFNVSLGADGRIRIVKIPQVGIVEIGDDVEIGANTTVDRARFGRTRIGNSVKLDNLIQVGHNVQIGDYSGVMAQVGIAGSTQIGSGCLIWAQAGLSGHIKINDRAQVGPRGGVSKDVPPGEYVIGTPAGSKRDWVKSIAAPGQVDKLKARVAELEARLARLEAART
jgi:UDP-3-O-[3-hydroxymyristoyl] glucosamine N-acyltransferase